MWEEYVGGTCNPPSELDRARLEHTIRGKLPDSYWQLACEHQGEALEATIEVSEQGEVNFGFLLLPLSPGKEKGNSSYCIERCLDNMRDFYPDGILPFADDTGGNYWAFDFRSNNEAPTIVFIEHEVSGEEGIYYVSDSFGSFMKKAFKQTI